MYNNPFFYNQPAGLFSSLKNIGLGTILSNTQKTLGIINQAIPIVYQAKPLINNMKTVFNIASEINRPDDVNQNADNIEEESDKPIFYI